jgi:hypothetical protein
MINLQGLKIYLFYGAKGSGKSLTQAWLANVLFRQYKSIEKRYPNLPTRKLFSNQKYSKEIEEEYLGKKLEYWENPRQLFTLKNCDIAWDEIGKDLPAGSWADTPKELRQVFSHLRKRGNRIFANTQVYKDIDIAFRRQVDFAFLVKKAFGNRDISATLPAPKFIWGLISISEFNSRELEEAVDDHSEKLKKYRFPKKFLWINKELVGFYDTTSEIPPYQPNILTHKELRCKVCNKITVLHGKM